MRRYAVFGLLLVVGLGLLIGCGGPTPTPQIVKETVVVPKEVTKIVKETVVVTKVVEVTPVPEEKPAGPEAIAAAFQKGGCGACHVIPGVANAQGTIGPDLSQIGKVAEERIKATDYKGKAKNAVDYIRESITDPDVYVVPECPGGPCQKGQMPPTLAQMLSPAELDAIVSYLAGLPEAAAEMAPPEVAVEGPQPPPLSEEEFAKAKKIFFDRCAGCHGVLRKGATGPALTPDKTLPKGTVALASIIFNGTPRGMPDWGKQGILTKEETELMAKFIQHEPPAPPEMPMAKMRETWKVFVAPEERPTEPQHTRNWQNFFSVHLRAASQVAIIDGDTKEIVNIIPTGYAVHVSRMSATGRYVYTIGRDGMVTLIDLWMDPPDKVAEVKVCYDARSVEVSKYSGDLGDYRDKYAIVGCYWPPHFVILDGLTLEPLKVVSTRSYTFDTEEYHPEPRVASIVAAHHDPFWVVNVKETGQIWLVDYRDPDNPTIHMIEADRFLHDGGWDSTRRYFLVAANRRNKLVVLDTFEKKVVAIVEVGKVPHPGRGLNFEDPEYGPVWCTVHLGEPLMACVGADPEGHPEHAWKVVRRVELLGGGSLFLKTHPNSPWIWVDHPLNPDEKIQRSICVIPKEDPTHTEKCWEVADYGRAVHLEFNKGGTELWVSVWGIPDKPGQTGEIVIYDAVTLEEKARIKDLMTPTGKFNVYNTMNDIY